MSDAIFSPENISKAKDLIMPLAIELYKCEPGNTMAIATTREGGALIDRVIVKLRGLGYSPTDSSFLLSEVLEVIHQKCCENPDAMKVISAASAPRTSAQAEAPKEAAQSKAVVPPQRLDKNSF